MLRRQGRLSSEPGFLLSVRTVALILNFYQAFLRVIPNVSASAPLRAGNRVRQATAPIVLNVVPPPIAEAPHETGVGTVYHSILREIGFKKNLSSRVVRTECARRNGWAGPGFGKKLSWSRENEVWLALSVREE